MRSLFTKLIQFPWHHEIFSLLGESLGVRPLSAVTIASSVLCGVAYFSRDRVSIELGVWCWYWEMLGPIFCLFLSGLLLIAFFRTERRHGFMFGLGLMFGLAAFAAWSYAGIYH
jgi:hypothetical protein